MKKTILLIPLLLAAAINIRAQGVGPATINAVGNSAIIGSSEFDWSIGEMTMVSTVTAGSIIITQGVLQQSDISVGVPNYSPIARQLKVFPNPASTVVNLQYSTQTAGTLFYKLMDLNGKIISRQTINVKEGATTEQINVSALACATYMLEVTVNTGNAQPENISYKIQKIK